jgi:hypothetical protein
MDQTCPRCGSDAAVTWTTAADGVHYTCRFSHGDEGPVRWTVSRSPRPAARTRVAPGSGTTRTPRTPAGRAPQSRTNIGGNAPSPPSTVNERGIAAVVNEVTRRGGQARVERDGNRREVIVTCPGRAGELRLLVRARTAGDWQTRASYGQPRAEEEHPTAFWVLVHLGPGIVQCYVVPEWWMQNDIYVAHEEYLGRHDGTRALNPDSDHHAIPTKRVAEWLDRWDQMRLPHSS